MWGVGVVRDTKGEGQGDRRWRVLSNQLLRPAGELGDWCEAGGRGDQRRLQRKPSSKEMRRLAGTIKVARPEGQGQGPDSRSLGW